MAQLYAVLVATGVSGGDRGVPEAAGYTHQRADRSVQRAGVPLSAGAGDSPAEGEGDIAALFVLDSRLGDHGRIRARAEEVGLGGQTIDADHEAQEVNGSGNPSTMGVEPPYVIIV